MDVEYKRQRRTSSRVEIVVDVSKPLDAKNFEWVVYQLRNNWLPDDRRPYDDAYFVELSDDELIIWWPEEDEVTSPIPADLPHNF